MEKSFDFIFALNGLPIFGSGGAKIIITLINILQEKGYRIGILLFPRESWILLQRNGKTPLVEHVKFKLSDSPFLYRIFNSLFRLILHPQFRLKVNPNVKIITINNINKYNCKTYIATNFINAAQLKSIGIPLEKIVLFSQIDETNPIYSGRYSDFALKIYKLFPKKIFINNDIVKRFPDSKKIRVGIDLTRYRLINPIDSRISKRIVFITRRGEQKDPATAIASMKKIHDIMPDIQILAYGNLNRDELPSFVNYYFMPSDEEVVAILNSSSVFVTTSVLEGYPAPPLEAMACGCAVISTDSVGIREYLLDGVNGIICPIKSPDCIVDSILKLVEDNTKRIEIAKNGYKTALEHSYRNMVKEFLDVINSFE